MNKNDYLIRLETSADHAEVEYLVRESFWNMYRPGCLEHYVLHCLRKDKTLFRNWILLWRNWQNHWTNIFVKQRFVQMTADIFRYDNGTYLRANDLKRKGYGKILLDYSIEKAKQMGAGALCFEGNIDFYGKSGFTYASEYGIRYHGLPEDADASFFLCKELIPGYLDGVTGEYTTPTGYFVDEEEAEEFDKQFPYKEGKITWTTCVNKSKQTLVGRYAPSGLKN